MQTDLLKDPHYPHYHFATPCGGCHPFDPNGALFWKGRYHLFHIFQDGDEKIHGFGFNSSWAHASSTDLIRWQRHPTALSPGDGDNRIYSGNALIGKDGRPTIVYNGGTGICIATSCDDGLIKWEKHPANPVIPVGADVHVWIENKIYYAILGGGGDPSALRRDNGKGDSAELYMSDNLVDWKSLGPFYKGRREWTEGGEDCACPDFFPLGNRHVLLFMSHQCGTQHYIGRYDGLRFHPEQHGRMNWPGGTVVAPETFLDAKGRRIMWNWACESRNAEAQRKAGWSGVMTLPRILSYDDDFGLRIEPVEEVATLRKNYRIHTGIKLSPGTVLSLSDIQGDCMELAIQTVMPDNEFLSICLFASPDGEEHTTVTLHPKKGTIEIDASASSLTSSTYHPWPHPWSAHHPPGKYASDDMRLQCAPLGNNGRADGRFSIRIFLDRSILEVFVNGRQCVTQRIYPTRGDSKGISLFCGGGQMLVQSIEAWDLD